MNRLSTSKRVAVISALVEGCSVRSTSRLTGVAKGTILRLLADVGMVCAKYQDETIRGIRSRRVQCDEIWSFVGAKQKNVTEERIADKWGDCWTWTGLDADSKLVISWRLGPRDLTTAYDFIDDLKSRLATRVQLTTDGLKLYLGPVEAAFAGDVDYAMLVKIFGAPSAHETRYSPAKCLGAVPQTISGEPDKKHISTSYVERQNLTMRMHVRRFTRLTNAFSKKIENHAHSVALFYMHYNFAKVHQTLRVTPAMEAGISRHVWSVEEIVALAEPALTKAA